MRVAAETGLRKDYEEGLLSSRYAREVLPAAGKDLGKDFRSAAVAEKPVEASAPVFAPRLPRP